MIDYATITEQAVSDHVRSGASDTSAADLRAVFAPIAQALRFFQNLAAGADIIIQPGAPASGVGKDGDVYIDATTTELYQQAAGDWGQPIFKLQGKDGKTPKLGVDYQNGKTPQLGVDYQNGKDGKDAYQVAVANGFSGTVTQWLASLKPKDGINGTNGADGAGNRWESYSPTNEPGVVGTAWYHVINAAKVALYECYIPAGSTVANAWRLRYTSPDAPAATVGTGTGTGSGTGTVKSVSVNGGTPAAPDGNGNVALTISQPPLYAGTGQNPDGPMTQRAVTEAVASTRAGTILFGTGAGERTTAVLGFQARVAFNTWALLGAGSMGDFQFQLTKSQTVVVGTYASFGDLNIAISNLSAAECSAGYFVTVQYSGAATGVVVNFKALTL